MSSTSAKPRSDSDSAERSEETRAAVAPLAGGGRAAPRKKFADFCCGKDRGRGGGHDTGAEHLDPPPLTLRP